MDGKAEVNASSISVSVEHENVSDEKEEVKENSPVVQVDPQAIISKAKDAKHTVIHFDPTVFSTDTWLDYLNSRKDFYLRPEDTKDFIVQEIASARYNVLSNARQKESERTEKLSSVLYGKNTQFPWAVPEGDLPEEVTVELGRSRSYCLNTAPGAACNLSDIRASLQAKGIKSQRDQNFILLSMLQSYGSMFFSATMKFFNINYILWQILGIVPAVKKEANNDKYFTYLEPLDTTTNTVRLRQQVLNNKNEVIINVDVILDLTNRSIRYENVFMVFDHSYTEVEPAFANVPSSLLHQDPNNSAITFVTQDVLTARAWIAKIKTDSEPESKASSEQQQSKAYKELVLAAEEVLGGIPTWFTNLPEYRQWLSKRFYAALEGVKFYDTTVQPPGLFQKILDAEDPYAPKPSTSFPWGRVFKWLLWSLIVLFSMMMAFGTVVGALLGKDLGFLDILGEGNNGNIIIFGAVGVGFLLLAKIYGSATWRDFCRSNWSIALPIAGFVVGALLIIAVPVLPAANWTNLSDQVLFFLSGSALALVVFSLIFGINRYLTPAVVSTTSVPPPTPQVNYSTPTLASLPSASITLNRFEVSLNALLSSCKLTLDETALKKVKEIFHGLSSDAKAASSDPGSVRNQLPNDPNYQNVAEALQIYIDREQPKNNIDPAVNGCLQDILGAYIQSQPQSVLPHSTSSLSSSLSS